MPSSKGGFSRQSFMMMSKGAAPAAQEIDINVYLNDPAFFKLRNLYKCKSSGTVALREMKMKFRREMLMESNNVLSHSEFSSMIK